MANLHLNVYNAQQQISDIDKDIKTYIEQSKENRYDEVLINDNRWEVFYNLSNLREALLNWYEFDENSNLLEIGGGFGALTGLFCKQCSHVVSVEKNKLRAEALAIRHKHYANLDIYASDINQLKIDERFDYVIAIGVLETQGEGKDNQSVYANFLNQLLKFLKPEGKLLFAVENRYGIRYFCGEPEPYSGIPFEGINKFPSGNGKGYLFDKHELCEIMKLAEIVKYKFYYPFPDYKMTQLVYSDEYTRGTNIRERLIPYYMNKDSLVASEMDLYLDLISNNVLDFFSNSFLVECSKVDNFCKVNYATVSMDRGKNNGFITTISKDDIVRKKAIYPEGIINLKNSVVNINQLREHGLYIIEHTIKDEVLEMPLEKSITCSNFLMEIISENKDEFIEIFDKLYACILMASGLIENDECIFNIRYGVMEWGPVLEKAYIDMVPGNCFYKNNRLYFFDQEFCLEKCPAKFVIYRAIKYTYVYIKMAEKHVPIKILKEHFDISEALWKIFDAAEKTFILDNRNLNLYRNYYMRTGANRKKIAENVKMLMHSQAVDKKILNVEVPPIIKKVQEIQIKLLERLIKLCNKHGLEYYLFYGSLLGAVRNGGMIPWDDDIDILMPRSDYNKLISIASIELEEKFYLQYPLNDENCFYGGYIKLRDCETAGFECQLGKCKGNQGIAIDIFPLDNVEKNNKARIKRFDKIQHIQRIIYIQTYGINNKYLVGLTKNKIKCYEYLAKLLNRRWLCKKLDQLLQSENHKKTELCGVLARYYDRNQCRLLFSEAFQKTKKINFSGMDVKIPIGYEQCLKTLYGRTYINLPSIDKRVPSHKYRYFTDISYRKFWCEEYYSKDKLIILFGSGITVDYFLNKYNKKFWPYFIVDNDEGTWGRNKQGIIIYPPSEIIKFPTDKYQLIICEEDYMKIIIQIRKMGIENYYIMRRW